MPQGNVRQGNAYSDGHILLILEAWCLLLMRLSRYSGFPLVRNLPISLLGNSGFRTSNQQKEDLQLQVQPRIHTGFPCIGLRGSPISKSRAKIRLYFII